MKRSLNRLILNLVSGISIALVPLGSKSAENEIRPFVISVEDSVIEDLNRRLEHTRLPEAAPKTAWSYGVPVDYLQSSIDYWRQQYDWRACENELNALDHFKTEIDGLVLHIVHQRSPHPSATALVLVHGWPGSFVEFQAIIEPLIHPEEHGGRPEDAFHVVVPSLPGFGFSEAPTEPGWTMTRMATAIAELMSRLGYERYGAQGGDWGAGIVVWLGSYDSEHVIGVHTNHPGFSTGLMLPETNRWEDVTCKEKRRWEKRAAEVTPHGACGGIQATRPQTLGFGLNNSPTGLAAWVLDKFWAWSDHGGDLDTSFPGSL